MNPGYVYILVNDAMPGLVKIGRTERDVELRASELWKTGVPSPFKIYGRQRTPDCVELEHLMHGLHRQDRVSNAREFFYLAPEVALRSLRMWALMQANRIIVNEFSDINVVPYEHWVNGDAIESLASKLGASGRTVSDAFAELTADEIRPAVERILSRAKDALK